MNIYNSLLHKKLCLPPSDPKMHCEPRGKLEMSTYPLRDEVVDVSGVLNVGDADLLPAVRA